MQLAKSINNLNLFNIAMKRFIIFSSLVVLFTLLCNTSAYAQVRYAEGRFCIDTAPVLGYKMNVGGNGAYFTMPNQSKFFQIDISSTNTRLAGHNDQVEFYNSATSKYNNISVLNVYYHSDARAKTNIQNFTQGLDVISRLRPVTYNFVNEGRSGNLEIGLLAQEIETILPDAVITDASGSKLVNYNMLIPVLIDAVKTLQSEVNTLKAQLQE